jgi:4'-phosphopantetheinyl transferase
MPSLGKSIQVWIVCVAEQKTEYWRTVLSETEWARAARFRMPADVNRFTVTRGVLRTLLAGYLQVSPKTIVFTENQYGKPAVNGTIQFNVSHSGDYALLAFAQDIDIGVDIERITDERVVNELARRVLTDAEYCRFDLLAPADRKKTFFQMWTLKESVLKGIGSGLSVAPECIEVAFYPDEPKLLSSSAQEITDVEEWTVGSLAIGKDDYAAAIAVKDKNPVIEVKWFE